jgi:hypothetical protein
MSLGSKLSGCVKFLNLCANAIDAGSGIEGVEAFGAEVTEDDVASDHEGSGQRTDKPA